MNAKVTKLIRKWCDATGAPYRRTKQKYSRTPRPERRNIKLGMLQEIS